ncbi:hypothetical protein PFISCL1PPCAC_14134, partial [Pristionchus fissidentatus]
QVRNCLICEAQISQIHMGIDACRACAVFYRRAKRSKCKIRCKKTQNCAKEGRVLECRSCRFDVMRRIFESANLEITVDRERSEDPPEEPRTQPDSSTTSTQPMTSLEANISILNCRCPNLPSTSSGTPVLDRVRCGYNVMTRIRKCAELNMRPVHQFVHPHEIDDNTFPIIPATHGQASKLTPVMLSALYDFASIAFPEFAELIPSEKWLLVRGCFERMHVIESTFRSVKIFPNDPTIFVCYTMTLNLDTVDYFLSDCEQNVNIESATAALRRNLEVNSDPIKAAMKRANPSDEEFLAMLALSFWTNDTLNSPESINRMATGNRTAIMKDIQAFYKSNGLTDYASRIGELYCLLVSTERVAAHVVEDLEMLRVMDLNQ